MDNVNPSSQPSKLRATGDDIPEAVRETVTPDRTVGIPFSVIVGATLGGALVFSTLLWIALQTRQPARITASPPPTAIKATNAKSSVGPDTLLGHFAYSQAPTSELRSLAIDASVQLRKSAADAFDNMVAAAQAEGVSLVPLSGFRSVTDQQHIFFDVKAERGQTATKRAEVSAPPGYSEHHTGYAVDIGDGNGPATNLNPDFDKTAAFKWLQKNANRYNFEMSFPKNNAQGVSYEPWHWRFVGDRQSLETFYKARQR